MFRSHTRVCGQRHCQLCVELLEARLTPATYFSNNGLVTSWLIQRNGAAVEVLADGAVQSPSDPSGSNLCRAEFWSHLLPN